MASVKAKCLFYRFIVPSIVVALSLLASTLAYDYLVVSSADMAVIIEVRNDYHKMAKVGRASLISGHFLFGHERKLQQFPSSRENNGNICYTLYFNNRSSPIRHIYLSINPTTSRIVAFEAMEIYDNT